jgi:AraC-like DNA-binding protein
MDLQSLPIDLPGTQPQVQRQIEPPAVCSPHRAKIDAHNLAHRSIQAQTRQVMTKSIGEHQIGSANSLWDYTFEIQHLSTGNFQLIDLQWQQAFRLTQTTPADRYLIYLVCSGHITQTIDLQQTCCSPDTATTIGPGQKLESISSQEGKALLISIDRNSIDLALGKLLDRQLKQPLIFRADIDLTSDLGLSLNKFLQFLWDAAAEAGAISASFVLKELERAFVACIIKGLPNNYTEELQYQHESALAAHVRKARVFIESNLHEDITVGDIATAVGVCTRLLQKAFAHQCGCSPMRFVTQSRLERIRQKLDRSTADTKIVDVMMDYGFTQGGKFAKEYQQLFGEKPSETLKRSSQLNHPESPWQPIDDADSAQVVGGCRAMPSSQMVVVPSQHRWPLISFGLF